MYKQHRHNPLHHSPTSNKHRKQQGYRPALALVLVLGLSACGGGNDDPVNPGTVVNDPPSDPPPTNNPVPDITPGTTPDGNSPTEPEPAPVPTPEPAPTPDPEPGNDNEPLSLLDYEDIDPATLPLTLTPLEPVVERPADVPASNQAPYFVDLVDQVVIAGQEMSVLIVPEDADGEVPGLFIDKLPPRGRYVDNMDGTRSLLWIPLQPDVGIFVMTITAVDAEAPFLRTSQTLRFQVIMPQDESTIRNLPPLFDNVQEQIVRAGDTVVQSVKAVDPNGTFGPIRALNLPPGATFTPHPDPEDEDIMVLRWTTSVADTGIVALDFLAIDAVDPALTHENTINFRVEPASAFDIAGPTFRELADARNFLFGYASSYKWYRRADGDLYGATAAKHFNIVTTENSIKWSEVNPEPGEYDWEDADRVVAFAQEHNMAIHGHPLLWHRQLPKWVQKLKPEERRNVMLAFIRTVVNRYNNDVEIWDVVNEALEEDGTFRQSPWFEAMGPDYIDLAFNQARRYAPDSKLLYNDYDVSWINPKSDAMYQLVQDLVARGVPLDGVGFQMHLETDFVLWDSVRENFKRFAELGLEIYITELDVAIERSTEIRQAEIYKEVFDACLAVTECKAIQTWGFTDRYSWRGSKLPLIFDRNYQPKPAFYAIREALQGP